MKVARWIRYGILAALVTGLLFFTAGYARLLLKSLLPLGIGILIAYILLPLVEMLEKARISRKVSILISYFIGLMLILTFLIGLIPILIENMKDITGMSPEIFETGLNSLNRFIEKNIPLAWQKDILNEIDHYFVLAQEWLTEKLYDVVAAVPKTLSIIFDFLVALILSFYILKDRDKIVRSIRYFFPESYRDEMIYIMRDLHRVVLRFIQGQVLIAIVIGVLETIGLYILRIPYAPLLGFIGGISNIVPYFGPYIGAIPALSVALTLSPWTALWTAIVFFIVQQVDNMFLSPRIMKGKLGLHPVITILAVIAGGRLFGFAGMIFSVPVTAMVIIVIKRLYRKVSG